MKRIITAAALCVLLPPPPVAAQGVKHIACGPSAPMERFLMSQGQTEMSESLFDQFFNTSVYASSKTLAWSILLKLPNGMACILARGDDWGRVVAAMGDPA